MMKSKDFITMLQKALNSNTVYALGMWGQILTNDNIAAKARQYPSFYTPFKVSQLKTYVGKQCFGFDCVCLVKAVLWGWNGSTTAANGSAKYGSNGVPDIGTDTMLNKCSEVSGDFTNIVPGALVWKRGHVGVYIGNGQVIECTAAWTKKVLQSALKNNGVKGQYERAWEKWGLLPYVDYSDQTQTKPKPVTPTPTKPTQEVTKFKNGDKVKLNRGAKTTKGVSLAAFVYNRVHDLTSVSATEGVIKYQGTAVATVFLKDLTLVSNSSTPTPTPTKPTQEVTKFKNGDKVKLNRGAKTTKGVSLAAFVYNRVHDLTSVSATEGVIKYQGTAVATVFLKDLTLVSNSSTPTPTPTKPAAVAKAVTEGCKVKLNRGAKTTKGVSLAAFVYNRVHIATNIKNGEAIIKYNGVIVARVFVKDLIVVD